MMKREWTRKGMVVPMAAILAFGSMPAMPAVAWGVVEGDEVEAASVSDVEDVARSSAVTVSIGGESESFASLEAAIAEVPDDGEATVRLNEDIVVSAFSTVEEGQKIVLDLNGHEITVSEEFSGRIFTNHGDLTIRGNGSVNVSAAEAKGYGTVNNYGTLKVEDGTYTNLKESNASNFYNRNGGTALFEDVTVCGGGGCVATEANTKTTINGGHYENETYPTIENRGEMLITAGTFVNTSCSSCDSRWGYTVRSGNGSDTAKLTMKGQAEDSIKVTGVQGGIAVIGGTAEIHNGTYETVACRVHTSGSSAYYAGYFTGESYKTATTIYGGTFKSCSKTAVLVGNGNPAPDSGAGKESTVTVYGGRFIGGDDIKTAISVNKVEHAIGAAKVYGGEFSSNPEPYVASGYQVAETDNHLFEVSKVIAAIEPTVRPDGPASNGIADFDYAGAYGEAGAAIAIDGPSVSITVDEAKLESFVVNGANEGKKAALTKGVEGVDYLFAGLSFPTPTVGGEVASKAKVSINGNPPETVSLDGEDGDSLFNNQLVQYFAFAKADGTLLSDAEWDVDLEWLDEGGDLLASSTVTVARDSVEKPVVNPGGGSGGGSTAPSEPEGEVTENPDGSTTTTVTEEKENADGSTTTTVTETTEGREDGSVTEKVTETTVSEDGAKTEKVTETNTLEDGTSATTVTVDGELASVEATVSDKAVEAAAGKAVELPMAPVEAASSDKAVEVKVEAPAGAKVAVPVAKAEGASSVAPGAVLVLVDAEGNETVLPKTANDGSSLSAEVPGDCTLKVVDASASFPDVDADGWYAEQGVADFVSARGIMTGVETESGAEFQGGAATNRGMFVTMLNRLEMEANASSGEGFADVDPGSWYAGSSAWAVEAGIATGYLDAEGNATFDGDGEVTREQMATFLFRYAQWLKMDTSARAEREIEGVSDFAEDAVSWAVAEGLIQGDDGTGAIRPTDGATRAEAAVVIMRMIGLMA